MFYYVKGQNYTFGDELVIPIIENTPEERELQVDLRISLFSNMMDY